MGEKLVIDYTGLSIKDIQKMDLDVFYFFRREAFIYKASQTPEGCKYLKDCWHISQTGADRQAIRENLTRKES